MMRERITVDIEAMGTALPMAFTVEAFLQISERLPEDRKDYGAIIDLIRDPVEATEVAHILMQAAAEDGKAPTAAELRAKMYMYEIAEIQKKCIETIMHGMKIEKRKDEGAVDEALMQIEKNAETGD